MEGEGAGIPGRACRSREGQRQSTLDCVICVVLFPSLYQNEVTQTALYTSISQQT